MLSKVSDIWKRVCDAWYNVPPKAVENLYKPMPRRMAAAIKAKGGLLDIGCDNFKHVSL